MITIGIQGGKGSFSEEAAYKFADNHGLKKIKIVYQISSEIVLKVLKQMQLIMVFLQWKMHREEL